ncbi:MAG: carboxypeptidase-like regulatory domain-containing protein [Candidatus Korobacteraceae bacterium]
MPGNTGNKIMDFIHRKEAVFPGVAITLQGAFSVYESSTVSDSAGKFIIDHVPEGIYVLTIAGGMKFVAGTADVTRLLVEVTDKANRDFLPLQLQQTGCPYGAEFTLQER